MAGIYIHIPFCKQACYYCDFHFSTLLKTKSALLKAIKKEIILRKNYFDESNDEAAEINSIYFGGGTPSLLAVDELKEMLALIYSTFNVAGDAEITMEANPDDLTKTKTEQLKNTAVNRLSIGIQSFYDDDLQLMNRAHSAKEAEIVIKTAQDVGFENLSVDLIYGIPTLDSQKWRNNLSFVFNFGIPHISAYCLTIEPKTAFAKFIKAGKLKEADDLQSAEQFKILIAEIKNRNYVQYEISNFCFNSRYSKHNTNYWLKDKYLGIGPSAHSFNGTMRQWNIANNNLYIKAITQMAAIDENNGLFESEELTVSQRYNEYVMTSLRTIWGCDLLFIKHNYGLSFFNYCIREILPYLKQGYVIQQSDRLYLTDEGKLFADKIAADLFWI